MKYSASDLKGLVSCVSSLDGDTGAVLECTSRYHKSMLRTLSAAGIFVSAVKLPPDPQLQQQHYPESQVRPHRLQKDKEYKDLILMGIKQLNATSASVKQIRREMDRLTSTLSEYSTVISMCGVSPTLDPQLIAEIGDIIRFIHHEALTAFTGVDPGVNHSGQFSARSNRASKCGPPKLRKALFLFMDCLLKTKSADDPVYQFLDKKRSEDKPYHVYMTAGANKFLHIYCGKVKAHLASQTKSE